MSNWLIAYSRETFCTMPTTPKVVSFLEQIALSMNILPDKAATTSSFRWRLWAIYVCMHACKRLVLVCGIVTASSSRYRRARFCFDWELVGWVADKRQQYMYGCDANHSRRLSTSISCILLYLMRIGRKAAMKKMSAPVASLKWKYSWSAKRIYSRADHFITYLY